MNGAHTRPLGTNGSASIRIPGMYATSRRQFLQRATSAAAFVAMARPDIAARVADASGAVAGRTPEDVAADEDFWREIQQAFTLDRTLINLNNGGVCPSPRVGARGDQALPRHLEPGAGVSHVADAGAEHRVGAPSGSRRSSAATPRSSPSRATPARRCRSRSSGSTSSAGRRSRHDQPGLRAHARHLAAARPPRRHHRSKRSRSRCRRRPWRISRIGSRRDHAATKVLHFCHITNLTGQIFPVSRSATDGARSAASRPSSTARTRSRTSRSSCAISAATTTARACTSGCSRRSGRVSSMCAARTSRTLWPLTPAGASRDKDIRKFEEIGTHPAANHNAIAEALEFHDGIGDERKSARLRYLRERWARPSEAGPARRFTRARSGAVMRDRPAGARRRRSAMRGGVPVEQAPHHRHADQARASSRGCASRRTSTRRSTTSIAS